MHKSINDLLCEFIPSPLNNNLSYCKICNIVIETNSNQKNMAICSKKLHMAAIDPNNHAVKLVKQEIIDKPLPPDNHMMPERKECNQEQIDHRMDICKECPFFQNNSCLQCGCALSRDRNYKNKLYFADQACPIGKWGPVA